jgi:hypothetical protein
MGLIGHGVAMAQIRGSRFCWIPGRFSAGKSAFSYRIAYDLARKYGYRIISNQESVWNEHDEPKWIKDEQGNITLRLIAIIDEGGLYLRDDKMVKEWIDFAGKMDLIVLIPSWRQPAALFQSLQVRFTGSFRSTGLPLDQFTYFTGKGKHAYEGKFYWAGMEEIYGVYSTLNPSFSPIGMVHYLRKKVREYKAFYMGEQNKQRMGWLEKWNIKAEESGDYKKAGGAGMDADEQAFLLENLALEISQAIDTRPPVPDGRKSRRRR